MSNRFPLVIDSATQRILELPATDNLDLTGSNISNVNNIISSANVNAQFFNGNGSALVGIVASTATFATTAGSADFATTAGSATTATTAGTVTTAAQPNITSLGSLTNLSVTGNLVPNNLELDKFNERVVTFTGTGVSITPDCAQATIFKYTANANFTFNSLANVVSGSSVTVIITQDATGSRTLTSTMKFAGGTKTLSTAANSVDIIGVFYDGTTYYASLTKGYV